MCQNTCMYMYMYVFPRVFININTDCQNPFSKINQLLDNFCPSSYQHILNTCDNGNNKNLGNGSRPGPKCLPT